MALSLTNVECNKLLDKLKQESDAATSTLHSGKLPETTVPPCQHQPMAMT